MNLKVERQQIIQRLLKTRSTVRIKELVQKLGVSESTIRRDLEELEQTGVLRRIHGGAVADTSGTWSDQESDSPYMRIGEAAAKHVDDGETVFLGPGNITMAVAQQLAAGNTGTIVTNALDIASYLAKHSHLQIILTGGHVKEGTMTLGGPLAEMTLDELRADKVILGVTGIHLPDGFTADSLDVAHLLRRMMAIAPKVVVVAEAANWGKSGPALLAPPEAIDTIITDHNAPPAMVWDLIQMGITIIQV